MPGQPWIDRRTGRPRKKPPVFRPAVLPVKGAAGASPPPPPPPPPTTGAISVRVQQGGVTTIPPSPPPPISGRNVTLGVGPTQTTDVTGTTVFSGVVAGTGLSVTCATPGGENATWTSDKGTASGSGFTASGITVVAGQTTNVVFDVTMGLP